MERLGYSRIGAEPVPGVGPVLLAEMRPDGFIWAQRQQANGRVAEFCQIEDEWVMQDPRDPEPVSHWHGRNEARRIKRERDAATGAYSSSQQREQETLALYLSSAATHFHSALSLLRMALSGALRAACHRASRAVAFRRSRERKA